MPSPEPQTASWTAEAREHSNPYNVGNNVQLDRLRRVSSRHVTSSAGRRLPPAAQPAIPFSTWFARSARNADILLLLGELIIMNVPHLALLMFQCACVPVAGAPHAAMQDAFPAAAHPSAVRADARLFSFPCGTPYPQQLLHAVTSGALTDPWVRLRAGDYVNLTFGSPQLLAAVLAIFVPHLYERVRHWLFFAANAGVLLGTAMSLAWTPAPLLPWGGASCLSRGRNRVMVTYLAWKSIVVLQVPSSHQLLFGPLLWLGVMALLPAMDWALPPVLPLSLCNDGLQQQQQQQQQCNHHDQQQQCLVQQQCRLQQQYLLGGVGVWDAVLSFLVIVVLPFVIVREWEVTALRPRYEADVEAAAAAAAALQRQQQRQQPLTRAAPGRQRQRANAHSGDMRAGR